MLLKETNDMNDNNDMFSPQTQPTQSLNELELHVAQEQHMYLCKPFIPVCEPIINLSQAKTKVMHIDY